MDNPTSSVAERSPGGPSLLSNGPSFRRPMRPSGPSLGSDSIIGPPINVATFVVHKDDNGYGMKVSGDNPVYVQSVKEGGAAEKAGLHSGDKIIKVNGENVTQSTHTQVVALIKSATQVVLTVQQRPPAQPSSMPRPASVAMTSPSLHARPLTHHHSAPARDRVTSPQPVDHEKLRQLECQRVSTLQLMLEKEQRYVEALRSEIAKSNDTKFVQELSGAQRRVRTLQDQLLTLQAAQQPGAEAGSSPVSSLHAHHRTKSSPDPLNTHNMSLAEASKRLIASESMSDLNAGTKRSRGVSWDVDSPRVTPPGTPPPPYGGANSSADGAEHSELDGTHDELHNVSEEVSPLRTQSLIMSMEDEDMSDQEMNQLEDHGPFKSLSKLWEHNAHLAVFMNYVISNSDPSSLLFYLVTDLYKEGNAKEMKKWAYEIHSSFLVPGAPLRLNNVDENVAREIDDVLLKEADKEEILRKIFWKARTKAKEELNEQLADFQQKRTAGLGTIFGPGDDKLDESIHDKNKELKIVETILMPKIEPYLEDIERDLVDIRRFTLGAALGTVLVKVFGLRGPHSNALLDRCPTFVSKDKSLKARFIGKSRKMTVRGHHFVAHQYFTVTYCNHCQLIIWGIGPQGYQCSNCLLNIHRHCVRVVEESCPGPINKKEKGNDRISKLMEKIRPERDPRRKPSSLNLVQVDRAKKLSEESSDPVDADSADRPAPGGRGGSVGSVGSGDRRPDPVREGDERSSQDGLHDEDDDHHHEITHHIPKKLTSNSINRSESYKERVHAKRQLRERRKTSDPNLSKTNDVDLDSQGLLSNTNSGSSSNSSLSTRSLESPSNSLEIVTNSRTQEALTVTLTPNSSGTLWDSDLESEPDPPDWSRGVEEEVLKQLSSREKKRQEVINELFHTERSHVRNLKVLDQVFHRPMLEREVLPPDQIQLLFSNLDTMLDIHSQFNNGMKCKRRENPLVGDLSDLLLSMFDGPAGDSFQHAAATFCARQQIALESLKERRRKDAKLHNFLTDAEVNPMCRRLQLKDIIPTALQRLTKYPLLFENLAKYTSSSEEEEALIRRAVERSKEILNHVNHAVREAEDNQRLTDIQKRLDKSAFDKVDHPMVTEYKTLDLTKHRLVYEGSLTWRIGNRTKLIDLHVVLLEDVIILLQKQDEKFIMKFLSISAAGGGGSPQLSPIIKVSTVLVRPNAVDKKALYLVNTSQNAAQIFDLVATSSSERKIWFRHISEAAEAYKTRDGKNRGRAEPSASSQPLGAGAPTTDIDATDVAHDKTKESEENDVSKSTLESPLPSNDLDASHNTSGGDDGLATGDSTASDSTTPQASPDSTEAVTKKLERLRRQDEAIRLALCEKQQLVADILHVPRDEFENIAELAGEPNADKDATELVLAAVNQANQLCSVLNDTLQVTVESAMTATSERTNQKTSRLPGVPTYKLQTISDALNSQLTELLRIIKHRDEEREQLRRELQKHREQIHAMHETRQRNHVTTTTNDGSEASQSRPPSCISEDDTGLPRCEALDDRLVEPPTPGTSVATHDDLATADEFVDALTSVEAESSSSEPHFDSNGVAKCCPVDDNLSDGHPTECETTCSENGMQD